MIEAFRLVGCGDGEMKMGSRCGWSLCLLFVVGSRVEHFWLGGCVMGGSKDAVERRQHIAVILKWGDGFIVFAGAVEGAGSVECANVRHGRVVEDGAVGGGAGLLEWDTAGLF